MKPGIRKFLDREAKRQYGPDSTLTIVRDPALRRGCAYCDTIHYRDKRTGKEAFRRITIAVSPLDVVRWDRSPHAQFTLLHELGHAFHTDERFPKFFSDHFAKEMWATIYGFRRFGRRLAPHLGVGDLLFNLTHQHWAYATEKSPLLFWLPIGWRAFQLGLQIAAVIILTGWIFGHR